MTDVKVKKVRRKQAETYARLITENMRTEDFEEETYLGQDPFEDVAESIRRSVKCRSAWRGNTLLCVYGVTGGKKHLIWMLATESMKEEPKALVHIGYEFIRKCVMKYGSVSNYISAWNERALRYIAGTGKIEGCQVELKPCTWKGRRLFFFEIRRKKHVRNKCSADGSDSTVRI